MNVIVTQPRRAPLRETAFAWERGDTVVGSSFDVAIERARVRAAYRGCRQQARRLNGSGRWIIQDVR